MTTRKTLMLAALMSIAPAGLVMAQSGSMPQDQTPATASSPAATESPSSSSSSTDSSSTSTTTTRSQHHMASKQAMKDCIAKQQQDNSGMSHADAKKACKQQMKGSG